MYTYKHCTWRSATAVKTLVQECCEKSVLFFFLLISFICTSIRISFDFLIYIYIYVLTQVTFRSSGTDILYGCHLLRRLYNILYFLWLYSEFLIILYNILHIAELDCCQIIILSIYVPSTHAYTHVLCLSLDLPYWDKVTLRLLKLFFIKERMWSSGLGRWT
jgi:hypothetical protein